MKACLLSAAALVCCLTGTLPAGAQDYSFSTVYTFCQSDCEDGSGPRGNLVQGPNGDLYGTAAGNTGPQTAFKLTQSGIYTTLHDFCSVESASGGCADGSFPYGGLLLAKDGNFYGTTTQGGSNASSGSSPNNGGTVFRLTPSGTLTTLYSFCSQQNCTDGATPEGGVVEDKDGNFYGYTASGGTGDVFTSIGPVAGTIFRISASGVFTSLYDFCALADCADGEQPSSLTLNSDGNLYGTTYHGGQNAQGTFFVMTVDGVLTTLYSFCSKSNCTDGAAPGSGLTLGADGSYYGTTFEGGAHGSTDSFPLGGTVFRITLSGGLTTLHSFCADANCADGNQPNGPLLLANDGNFYGSTEEGGIATNGGQGTLFRMTPSGALTTVYLFCPSGECTDGEDPSLGLTQASNGALYGATLEGGSTEHVAGTVFALSGLTGTTLTSRAGFSASPYPSSVGQPVTLTASISGPGKTPTGSVAFTDEGYVLCNAALSSNAVASCTLQTAEYSSGEYTISAKYSGDLTYNAASNTQTAFLDSAPTKTKLAIDPPSVSVPGNVTLTATATRSAAGASGIPEGTVTFLYGAYQIATVSLNSSGVATLTASTSGYPKGEYGLTARYNGDYTDDGSASPVVTLKLK